MNMHIPTVGDKYVLISLESKFPPATKQSAKAKQAMVDDMVSKGATREMAESQAHGYLGLFPDGELKAIKTPYYAFDTYLRRVTIKWVGGKGAARLLSITQLDTLERKFNAASLKILPLWQEFKSTYVAKLKRLEQNGGQYFDLSAYPDINSLDNYFRFDLTVQPIADPSSFDMGGLSQEQADTLKQRLSDAMAVAGKEATEDYARKLIEQLNTISKGMATGKVDGKHTRFSSSNLDKLKELIAADLNVTDDHNLNMAIFDVKDAIRDTERAIKGQRESDKNSAASTAAQAASKLAGLFSQQAGPAILTKHPVQGAEHKLGI